MLMNAGFDLFKFQCFLFFLVIHFSSYPMSSSDSYCRSPGKLVLSVYISCLVLISFNAFLWGRKQSSSLGTTSELKCRTKSDSNVSATNISHIRFVLVSSLRTWKFRKPYIEAWWRPNETRGNIFMDLPLTEEFLPWPSSSPPFQVSEDITKLRVYSKLATTIGVRHFRSILETYRLGDNEEVKWYVMGDDDTLFFVDNLVEVLSKYDHTKYYYIGANSETFAANQAFSFDMAFGGAGYALSFALVEALAPVMDECIERNAYSKSSDNITASCCADLGVTLTIEKGFHQFDVMGDVSGLLSSHPQSPLLSIHHFDFLTPLFPFKNRYESIHHLMEAAKVDQSRLLQQTICYHRQSNWSFSVSWGYSTQIYESIIPRSVLRKPLETFYVMHRRKVKPPYFIFNTRNLTELEDPCAAPHVFFMESVKKMKNNLVLTTYGRKSARNLPPCSSNHSADTINKIQVLLNSESRKEAGIIECCDVNHMDGSDAADIKLRACMKGEVIA